MCLVLFCGHGYITLDADAAITKLEIGFDSSGTRRTQLYMTHAPVTGGDYTVLYM